MYRIKTIVESDGVSRQHLIKDNGDGSFTSFLLDENNPNSEEYIEWTKESPANVAAPADE